MCFASNVTTTPIPGSRGTRDIHKNRQVLCGRMTGGVFCTNLPSNSVAALYWRQLGEAEGNVDILLSW